MTPAADVFAVLGLAPALPGARCRGRSQLFDEAAPGEHPIAVDKRHEQALRLCRGCPSLDPCRAWVATLKPSQKPRGVIAGDINHGPRIRAPRTA